MSAPSAFQHALEKVLNGMDNVVIYLDDIIIATPTNEQNYLLVMAITERFQKYGLTVNWDK